jgi:hypothetical protein
MLSLISKVALVSDSSAGIGHETALVLSRNGYYTYAGMGCYPS